MATARKPGDHTKHVISGPWIRVNRDRAFSRCHVNLYIRTTIDGHEFYLQSWARFFDLLERRDGAWRIVKRTAVYEKDRMNPVDPRDVPKDFFSDRENGEPLQAGASSMANRPVSGSVTTITANSGTKAHMRTAKGWRVEGVRQSWRTHANQGLQGLSAIGGSETLVSPVNPVYLSFRVLCVLGG
jgi:hypothetical protein